MKKKSHEDSLRQRSHSRNRKGGSLIVDGRRGEGPVKNATPDFTTEQEDEGTYSEAIRKYNALKTTGVRSGAIASFNYMKSIQLKPIAAQTMALSRTIVEDNNDEEFKGDLST